MKIPQHSLPFLSYPYFDILKNTALAHMRLYEILNLGISAVPETNETERILMRNRTKVAVHEYLTYHLKNGEETANASKDKDYDVFLSFYKSLH